MNVEPKFQLGYRHEVETIQELRKFLVSCHVHREREKERKRKVQKVRNRKR